MSGDITSLSVYPIEGSRYHCGNLDAPYAKVHSNHIYSIGSDGSYYVQLTNNTQGTANTQGIGCVYIGNSIPNGTAGNAKGRLVIFNSGANYAVIQDHDSATSNRLLTLPRVTGQIPVVSVSGTTLNINY